MAAAQASEWLGEVKRFIKIHGDNHLNMIVNEENFKYLAIIRFLRILRIKSFAIFFAATNFWEFVGDTRNS